jgi:hypothetical protein
MSFGNFLADAVKKHFDDDDDDKDNLNPAASHAAAHSSSSEDSSLFSTALKFVKERKSAYDNDNDVDEEHVVNAHKRYEEGGNTMDSRDLGAGAALQALKLFNQGSGEQTGGGKDKNAFIGLAMAQAGRMWEEKAGKGEAVCFFFFPNTSECYLFEEDVLMCWFRLVCIVWRQAVCCQLRC